MILPWTVDAGLLMALAFPIVMRYRIMPIEGTPYWLFGVLFFLFILNISISLFSNYFGKYIPVAKTKFFITLSVITIVVGGATATAIADRHRIAPALGVHDIILQQEAAIRYLIHGKNPYKETYFGTPVESFRYDELGKPAVNPALYHFVMPPWYLLFPFVFYSLANHTIGYFDGRIVLLFCLFGTIFTVNRLIKNEQIKLLAIIFLSLSPGIVDYFIEGRSDAFALFWLIAAIYFLEKKIFWIASLLFGLALLSKQTIWFAFPFYFIGLWKLTKESVKDTIKYVFLSCSVLIVFAAPFIAWNYKAFFDSVILYLSGGTKYGYPVSGYGFGMILYDAGLIKNIHEYFPFAVFQILFGLPVLAISMWYMFKKPLLSRFLFGYGFTLLVIWYFSRYFNNSHLGFVSTIFVLAMLKDWDEKVTS